jgi:hypothetical protein
MTVRRDGPSTSVYARASFWLGALSAAVGIANCIVWFHNFLYAVFLLTWGLGCLLAIAGGVHVLGSNGRRRGIGRALGGVLLPLPIACGLRGTWASDMDGRLPFVSNLRQLGVGLATHNEYMRGLPSAALRDQHGSALLSWRVPLLPFIEHGRLHKQFKLDQAWDGPHNLELLKAIPFPYASHWDAEPEVTHFLAFVGPGTAFESRPTPLRLTADFPDGLATTFLVVEAQEAVPWTKPAELAYNPERPVPPLGRWYSVESRGLGRQLVYSKHGFLAVFADGSARFVRSDISEHVLRAAIERNDGKIPEWDPPAWDGRHDSWPAR